MQLADTRTSCNTSSLVTDARKLSLCVISVAEKPGASVSTR
jgi:hypothetical protein